MKKITAIHLILTFISVFVLILEIATFLNNKTESQNFKKWEQKVPKAPFEFDNPLNSLPPRPAPTPKEKKEAKSDEYVERAIVLIKKFEGFHENAYHDPKTGNLPITIGWGSTVDEKGKPFHMGDKITKVRAENLLINQLVKSYIPKISKVPFWNSMGDGQKAALVSFGYNLGSSFYGGDKFKTITSHLKSKKWTAIPDVLTLYSNPKSKVHKGLLARRNVEAKVWSKDLVKN